MSAASNHNEKELFRQIAAGDQSAFTAIFHIYTPQLFTYILKITKDEQLAKEMLQETFLKLWIKREDLLQVQHPAGWLFRIAANNCLSYLRIQAGRNQLQHTVFEKMKPAGFPVLEKLEGRDTELLIHKAVQLLPPKRKEVYLLSRVEGFTHQEIADRLGLSINTVKNHLGMALKSIQEYLHNQTGLSMTVLLLLLAF